MVKEEIPPHIPIWRTKRYQVAALFFLGCVFQSTLKYNLSIAIVCMVKHTDNITDIVTNKSDDISNNWPHTTISSEGCPDMPPISNSTTSANEEGEFVWSKQLQGFLLGAMFWGFVSGQVLCGSLSQRYGARTVIGLGVGGGALLTLISPFAARTSPYLFMAVRLIIGLCLACVYPSLVVFWARWAPPAEYSRMMGLSLSGSTLGNAVVFPIGGLLCGGGVTLGWSSVFYFTGGLTACWSVLWMVFVRDTPAITPGISNTEKQFLEQCLQNRGYRKKVGPIPWRGMLTSIPVIALVITHALGNYCLYMLFTLTPPYLYEVLRLDIQSNGLYSMLPLVCMAVVTNVCGQVSDLLISRQICTVSATRKIFNTIGCVTPGVFLVVLAHINCQEKVLAVSMLCLAAAFVGSNFSGHIINYGDIALIYAGTLSGLGNTFSSLPGIIAPYAVSAITTHGTQAEWRVALYVAACCFGLAALVFLVFGSGEIQPWAISQSVLRVPEDVYINTEDKNHETLKDFENDTELERG